MTCRREAVPCRTVHISSLHSSRSMRFNRQTHIPVSAGCSSQVHSSGKSPRAAAACKGGRKCTECGATETPQWRQGEPGMHAHNVMFCEKLPSSATTVGAISYWLAVLPTVILVCCSSVFISLPLHCRCAGPEGPQTLCNACGVRHSRQMRKMRGAKCAKLSVAATPSPSPSWVSALGPCTAVLLPCCSPC